MSDAFTREPTTHFVVVWFPDDVPERRKSFPDEKAARKHADSVAEFLPILIEEVSFVTERTVENYADRRQP